jgi:serine/threonine protein kinase
MACCFGGRRPGEQTASPSPTVPPAGQPGVGSKQLVLPGCDPVRLLGEGSFGTVVLVRERATGALFAAKIMSKAQLVQEDQLDNIITERRVLREAGPHPFVIECHSGFQTPDAVVLVLEYLSGGDMFDLLKKNGCLGEAQARFYVAETLIGLLELHRLNFVFRDLKLENILLDHAGHVRLTDFGLAGQVESGNWDDRTITDISGTAIYQAPEMLSGMGHGRVVDFWALGILTHVILTGRPPFAVGDGGLAELYRLIRTTDVDFAGNERLSDVSPHCIDFMRQLLQRDPSKRLGSADSPDSQASIRTHPFFEGIDWDALLQFRVPPPLPPPLSPPPGLFLDGTEEPVGGTGSGGSGSGVDTGSAAAAEKHVFNKLAGHSGASKGVGRKASRKKRQDDRPPLPGLDAGEYKVVDVASALEDGRVSIGLDFRGRSEDARTKTWTGTTDDFGRFMAPQTRSAAEDSPRSPGVSKVE